MAPPDRKTQKTDRPARSLSGAYNNATTPAPVFNLDAEAASAFAAYPQLQNKVVFRDVSSGRILAASDTVLSRAKYIDNTNRDLSSASRHYDQAKTSGCYSTREMDFILFYQGADTSLLPDVSSGLQLHYIFRHELAHTLSPDARRNGNLSESIADSYAATFLLHSYGDLAVPLVEKLIEKRVRDVLDAPDDRSAQEHFTAPALREVLAQYKNGTLDKNPLTAAAAIAALAAIPPERMQTDAAKKARALQHRLK
jgi:hypothetical protein